MGGIDLSSHWKADMKKCSEKMVKKLKVWQQNHNKHGDRPTDRKPLTDQTLALLGVERVEHVDVGTFDDVGKESSDDTQQRDQPHVTRTPVRLRHSNDVPVLRKDYTETKHIHL